MEKEKSCGCVIIKGEEVLLVKQVKGHWGFPKGHVENGETEMQTAIREVKEETNIDVEIQSERKFKEEYIIVDTGIQKEVIYFIAKPIGGNIKPQEAEINTIKWLTFNEAIETLTYEDSKKVLREVLKELEK